MRRENIGVTKELLKTAKKEFLEYGFYDASLRRISKASGVSTNSIYTRFNDKEGLFDAIVKESADGLIKIYKDEIDKYKKGFSVQEAENTGENGTISCLNYIYQHFDEFYLIFCCSKGTHYEDYFDRLASIEEALYKKLVKQLGIKVDTFFIHVMCRAGWNYMCEAVSHRLTYKQAVKFIEKVMTYTYAGWKAMLEEK